MSPRPVQSLLKHRVVKIALGDVHAAAVTDQGALFTWGENAYGRLGLGDTKRRYGPEPVRSLAVQRVTDVSLGTKHFSACLNTNTGRNTVICTFVGWWILRTFRTRLK